MRVVFSRAARGQCNVSGVSGFVPITISIAVEGDSQSGGARFCVGVICRVYKL